MKVLSGIFLLVVILVIIFGSPFPSEKPLRARYYNSPEPILPMSFEHQDHVKTNCLVCHHNYLDDTGIDMCMNCHVTNQEVWPLLEDQFHDLCRGCHAEKAAEDADDNPPRECIACHRESENQGEVGAFSSQPS